MRNIILIIVMLIIAQSCNERVQKTPVTRSNLDVEGVVVVRENGEDVEIVGELAGFEPNHFFAFHIHETGDCSSEDFSSAGGHYAPNGNLHGSPTSGEAHKGDLGNLRSDSQGVVKINITVENSALGDSKKSLSDKSLIIHERKDDFTTQPSGNSGARIACVAIN